MKNQFVEDSKKRMFSDLEALIALACGYFGNEGSEFVKDLLSKYGSN